MLRSSPTRSLFSLTCTLALCACAGPGKNSEDPNPRPPTAATVTDETFLPPEPSSPAVKTHEIRYFSEGELLGYQTFKIGSDLHDGDSKWWDRYSGFLRCLQRAKNEQTEYEITYWSRCGELIKQERHSVRGIEETSGPSWFWPAESQDQPTAPWLGTQLSAKEWIMGKIGTIRDPYVSPLDAPSTDSSTDR